MNSNNMRITLNNITDIQLKDTIHYSRANPNKVWFHHLELTFVDMNGNRSIIDVHSFDDSPTMIHRVQYEEASSVI